MSDCAVFEQSLAVSVCQTGHYTGVWNSGQRLCLDGRRAVGMEMASGAALRMERGLG